MEVFYFTNFKDLLEFLANIYVDRDGWFEVTKLKHSVVYKGSEPTTLLFSIHFHHNKGGERD